MSYPSTLIDILDQVSVLLISRGILDYDKDSTAYKSSLAFHDVRQYSL